MSLLLPIAWPPLGVPVERYHEIVSGLNTGALERVGGVIRDTRTKKIVLWLRPIGESVVKLPQPAAVMALQLAAAANIVSLSLSAVSIEHIRRKITQIEQQLKQVSVQLVRLERKLDMEYSAQLRGALNQAQLALSMEQDQNRRDSALQAIERLLSAEQMYLALLEASFVDEIAACPPLIQGIALSRVAAARCMLVLGEQSNATKHLEDGQKVVTDAASKLHARVIEPIRAMLLRPEFGQSVSLRRLTDLARMAGRQEAESDIFDEVRAELGGAVKLDLVAHVRQSAILGDDGPTSSFGLRILQRWSSAKQELKGQLVAKVEKVVDDVEVTLETAGRVQGLALELRYLKDKHVSFEEWQRLPLPPEAPEGGQLWLIPAEDALAATTSSRSKSGESDSSSSIDIPALSSPGIVSTG